MNGLVKQLIERRERPSRIRSLAASAALTLLWVAAPAGQRAEADEPPLKPPVQLLTASPKDGVIHLNGPGPNGSVFRELHMEHGKALVARPDYKVRRVAVGNPEIFDVIVIGPQELQFVAKSVGATNVLVWARDGKIRALIDVYVGAAGSQVTSALRRVLKNDSIEMERVGGSVVLSGPVPSALAMEQALMVSRALLPPDEAGRVINMMEIGGGQQVMLEVVIAEMSRSLKRALGTNFHTVTNSGDSTFEFFNFLGNLTQIDERSWKVDPDSLELIELTTLLSLSDSVTLAGSGFGIGTGLYEIFFELLDSHGLGKVLAEPTLVARSGETASFLVGGEVPIPVAQGGAFGSITIDYKDFGVGLSFTPTVLEKGRIHLRVSPEVSEPNLSLGITQGGVVIPAFSTRRATTTVELGDGQSFAIAGLLQDRTSELVDSYPMLGNVPVLGGLFRSSSFQKDETELVMIVTPRIVKPLPAGPHPLPTDHFIEPSAFEFYLLGRLEARGEDESGTPTPTPEPEEVDLGGARVGGIIGGAGQIVGSEPQEEMQK